MKYTRNDSSLKQRRQELRRNQTDAEKAVWKLLRNRQLLGLKFLRQYSIGPYILDFYCPKAKLALELDGGQHTDVEKKEYDNIRTKYLGTHGIKVMRFWNSEISSNIEGVIGKILSVITPPNLPFTKGEEKGKGVFPPTLKVRGGRGEL